MLWLFLLLLLQLPHVFPYLFFSPLVIPVSVRGDVSGHVSSFPHSSSTPPRRQRLVIIVGCDQAPAFALGVAQDRIFNDLPHIDFVPLHQCIKEDYFIPSYYAEVL